LVTRSKTDALVNTTYGNVADNYKNYLQEMKINSYKRYSNSEPKNMAAGTG